MKILHWNFYFTEVRLDRLQEKWGRCWELWTLPESRAGVLRQQLHKGLNSMAVTLITIDSN